LMTFHRIAEPRYTTFVILSRRKAAGALDWTRGVMSRIGLTLNEAKTHIRQANLERFDFLGYTFGPHRFRKDGYVFIGESADDAGGATSAMFFLEWR
jgi:hypothetical protein